MQIASLLADGAILANQDGNHGGIHPKASDYVNDGVPFIMCSDLKGGTVDLVHCKKISEQQASKLRVGFAKEGDVLLTHKGTMGLVAMVPALDTPYAMLTPQVTYYRVNASELHPRYLAFAFQHRDFQHQLQSFSAQSTRAFISISAQRQLSVLLHERAVQGRIADILSAYDDLIENNTKRIEALDEMSRSLYHEWFVNLGFPGHEKVTMVKSSLGKVPEGWTAVELGSLVDEVRDAIHPSSVDPETPYFGLEHLPRRSLALGEWGRAAEVQSTKLRVQPMDILFGKIRPYFHKVGPSPVEAVCSSDAIVLRVRNAEDFGLVLALVSSDEFVQHATLTSQGTKMPRANWDVLRRTVVLRPPTRLLARFNAVVTDGVELVHTLLFKNRNLSTTRDLLLPRLLSGEVAVGVEG